MRITLVGVAATGMLVLSTAASAQTPDTAVGRKVWITMADASVHQGTVARVTREVVTLTFDGATVALASRDVRRIEAPDRVSDGVAKGAIGLLGAAVGGAAGAIVGGLLDAGNPAREVIFERTSLSIAPVMTGRSRSVSLVIGW